MGLRMHVLGGSHRISRVVHTLWILARLRPDIVHAHNPSSLHYAVLGKLRGKTRVVMTYHGRGQRDARVPSRREWRRTDAVVAVSHAAAHQLNIPEIQQKLSVIWNGVLMAPASRPRDTVRAEFGLDDRVIGIIVARIDGLKGHDTLLQSLSKLRTRTPIIVLIVGDGVARTRMEQMAQELQLGPEKVLFLGMRSDVPDLLAASDLFLLPSVTEGLPLSILEAMSQRLPIVATAVGGIPEIVSDGEHGLLVPAQDPQALAEAIERLVDDPSLRDALGEAAYRRVQEAFSFEAMLLKYDALYQTLR